MAGSSVTAFVCVVLAVSIAGIQTQFASTISYKWDQWTSWTHCNATCDGTTYRIRACLRVIAGTQDHSVDVSHCSSRLNGAFDYDRKSCGPDCNQNLWSTWSVWSVCSATCNAGVKYRARHCENGDKCVGEVFEQHVCNDGRCLSPVNGTWGAWGSWGTCSSSCELGYNVRYRSCDSPAPKDGGADCVGKHDQVRVCPLVKCPIDGGWGNYSTNTCTVSCGIGVLVSVRQCDNPPPQYGGKQCIGQSTKFEKCVKELCAVDGEWSEWGNLTTCQVVCGDGHVTRSRTCTSPPPQNGGADCVGKATEEQECNNGLCPSDIKICNKVQVQSVSAQISSNMTSSNTNCIITSPEDSFAMLETYCSITHDVSKWRLGIKIHNNCEMIPLYSPVGSSDNGVHVKEVGVLTDCFGDTLKMLTQSCKNDTVLKSYNLTDMYTSVHMILFEN